MGTTKAAWIVEKYFQQQALVEIGYTFPGEDLETFEADCFTIIYNELKRLEIKELKKNQPKG